MADLRLVKGTKVYKKHINGKVVLTDKIFYMIATADLDKRSPTFMTLAELKKYLTLALEFYMFHDKQTYEDLEIMGSLKSVSYQLETEYPELFI